MSVELCRRPVFKEVHVYSSGFLHRLTLTNDRLSCRCLFITSREVNPEHLLVQTLRQIKAFRLTSDLEELQIRPLFRLPLASTRANAHRHLKLFYNCYHETQNI